MNKVKELERFTERKESFEKITELLLAETHGADEIYFFPNENEGILEWYYQGVIDEYHEKQLKVDGDILKDISGFSPYVFELILVSDEQVFFRYAREYLVYNGGEKFDKGEFYKRNKFDKRGTTMWNLGDGWYYLRKRLL